jgi:hypothetical protein
VRLGLEDPNALAERTPAVTDPELLVKVTGS